MHRGQVSSTVLCMLGYRVGDKGTWGVHSVRSGLAHGWGGRIGQNILGTLKGAQGSGKQLDWGQG